MKRLVVVGDSDIAYWPKNLLPSPKDYAGRDEIGIGTEWDQPLVSGHSGATLAEVLPHLRKVLAESTTSSSRTNEICGSVGGNTKKSRTQPENTLVVVACAGENDIGEGISLGKSVESLKELADAVFLENHHWESRFLVFLGPKLEPWLEHDPSYKKKYDAMARAFKRCLEEYETTAAANSSNDEEDSVTKSRSGRGDNKTKTCSKSDRIHFIDCLTMFCGETANVPGARLGGRARADPRFFASDQLHLSKDGYGVWKDVTETRIRMCLSSSN